MFSQRTTQNFNLKILSAWLSHWQKWKKYFDNLGNVCIKAWALSNVSHHICLCWFICHLQSWTNVIISSHHTTSTDTRGTFRSTKIENNLLDTARYNNFYQIWRWLGSIYQNNCFCFNLLLCSENLILFLTVNVYIF